MRHRHLCGRAETCGRYLLGTGCRESSRGQGKAPLANVALDGEGFRSARGVLEGRSTLQSSPVSSLLCVYLGFRCLCATNHVKQHVGKGGSAVPKPEMEQGGFFSGDFNFVYSDESGFH